MTTCPECNGTGQRDSGGTHPWGEPVYLPCECKDAEIGRRWHEDSSLEKWFPLTAEWLAALEAENAALAREAHTWSKAAEVYAKDAERLRQALLWIEGATAATPGLTDAELGRAMAAIGKTAREALGPNVF